MPFRSASSCRRSSVSYATSESSGASTTYRSRGPTSTRETIIAVNFGGCVIPTGLALYELLHIAIADSPILWAVLVAGVVNIAVCYFLARPVQGVGILLPGLVPAAVAAVAAVLALIFAPGDAAAVAYVAGVGPLIGADLLHLREIEQSAVGVASIGGAGTFDGIVLSGIVAAYLA